MFICKNLKGRAKIRFVSKRTDSPVAYENPPVGPFRVQTWMHEYVDRS